MTIPENFPVAGDALVIIELANDVARLEREAARLRAALHALATGLRWEEELRAWVLTDLGALTGAREALGVGR